MNLDNEKYGELGGFKTLAIHNNDNDKGITSHRAVLWGGIASMVFK